MCQTRFFHGRAHGAPERRPPRRAKRTERPTARTRSPAGGAFRLGLPGPPAPPPAGGGAHGGGGRRSPARPVSTRPPAARSVPLAAHASVPYRDPLDRLKDYEEINSSPDEDHLQTQGARCMDCGVPFCQSANGCPIDNLIPEWNHLVYQNRWIFVEKGFYRCLIVTDIRTDILSELYQFSK